jgi:hypothetical protein
MRASLCGLAAGCTCFSSVDVCIDLKMIFCSFSIRVPMMMMCLSYTQKGTR